MTPDTHVLVVRIFAGLVVLAGIYLSVHTVRTETTGEWRWAKVNRLRVLWLRFKVRVIRFLQRRHILPNVWYKEEIELARHDAKRLRRLFDSEGGEPE